MVYLTVCTAIVATGHNVQHTVVLTVLERSVNRYMMTIGHQALAYLVLIQISGCTQF